MITLIGFVSLALIVSFLCSIAETVLISITPAYIENLREENPRVASRLKILRQDKVDRSLASILTMNTIAHTVGAIEAGAQSAEVFGSQWVGLVSVLMTLLILYLSEIIPKTLGAVYWPSLVGVTTVYVRVLIFGLYPLVRMSEWVTQKIIGRNKANSFKRDEFVALAGLGEEEGKLDEHETKIIKSLFKFRNLKAIDVMTPRTVITSLPDSMLIGDAQSVWSKIPFSRCPLYRDDPDDIVGFALKNEILSFKGDAEATLSVVKRKIPAVLESIRLPVLLENLLEMRLHIALVVDEYGSIKGLVTLEDVLETLLDMEIVDELDSVEDMRALARRQWSKRATELGFDVKTWSR